MSIDNANKLFTFLGLPELSFFAAQVANWTNVLQGLTLRLKSYTSNITKCLMTELYSGRTSRNVTCSLSGRAPEFNLSLHLGEETWIRPGKFTLDVTTEFGTTNLTFELINDTAHSKYTILTISVFTSSN